MDFLKISEAIFIPLVSDVAGRPAGDREPFRR
jgi:hypothetical protein